MTELGEARWGGVTALAAGGIRQGQIKMDSSFRWNDEVGAFRWDDEGGESRRYDEEER
jgi:hypothetical protein